MADNTLTVGSPIPQGAQIGEAQASPAASLKPGDPIPQGSQIGDQQQPEGDNGILDSIGHHASDIMHNFTAGAVDTGMGLGELGHRAIHAALPEKAAEVLSPK